MSTGSVDFFSMRGSLSTGEYPLLTGSETPIHSIASVKYRAGLQISIDVPSFTGYDIVNVARIGGQYYWVTAFEERTTAENSQIRFTLDYMAPTSLIRNGQSVSMYLDRSPTYIRKYLSDDFTKGEVGILNPVEIGNISPDTDHWVYWVQISGYVNAGGINYLQRYGFFIGRSRSSSGSNIWQRLYATNVSTGDTYPGLVDLFADTTSFCPIAPSDVVDISISKRCPYDMIVRSSAHGNINNLADGSGAPIIPRTNGTGAYLTYYLDDLLRSNTLVEHIDTVTIELDDYLRMCGSISVRDEDKNKVASFPIAQGSTFTVQTIADYTGLITVIDNGYQRAMITEGKLPWNASAWSDYRAYDMAADRQVAINAMEYAGYNYESQNIGGGLKGFADAISSMIFGGIAGKGVGALAGGVSGAINLAASAYENERAYDLSITQAQNDFALSQIRAKNARGTAYNTGYGLIYATMTGIDNDLVIGVDEPIESDGRMRLQEYTDRIGWPCEGLVTMNAAYGYYKGMMPSSENDHGMYFDELNRTLGQGFKFVSP